MHTNKKRITKWMPKAFAMAALSIAFNMQVDAQVKVGGTAIHIYGMVVNASTLEPVSNAVVKVDSKAYKTDMYGSFVSIVNVPANRVKFSITVKKDGFSELKDLENWDRDYKAQEIKTIFLLGIDQKNRQKQFVINVPYDGKEDAPAKHYLDSVLLKESGDRHLQELSMLRDSMKVYLNQIFFTINNVHFIAGNHGYLIVRSDDELVAVNSTLVKAIELNGKFKRGAIKEMTPVLSDSSAERVQILLGVN